MSIIICRNNSRLIFVKTITGAIWRSNEQLTSLLRNGNRDGNRNLASALLETVSLFLFILFSDLLERSESKIVRGDTETQSSAHTVIGAADQSINSLFCQFTVRSVRSSARCVQSSATFRRVSGLTLKLFVGDFYELKVCSVRSHAIR